MTGSYRVTIEAGRCVGAGQCVLSAPDVFDQDAAGFSVVRAEVAVGDHWPDVEEAAERCPVRAIATHVD